MAETFTSYFSVTRKFGAIRLKIYQLDVSESSPKLVFQPSTPNMDLDVITLQIW